MKAEILNYGYIENNIPYRFAFDCKNSVIGIEYRDDGTILYGGYTVDELRELAIEAIGKSYEP